jgi:hypothetical protein
MQIGIIGNFAFPTTLQGHSVGLIYICTYIASLFSAKSRDKKSDEYERYKFNRCTQTFEVSIDTPQLFSRLLPTRMCVDAVSLGLNQFEYEHSSTSVPVVE